jgi:SAM-dependent methyltransferase
MPEDTTKIWQSAARSENPFPVLLLGRTSEEYFREGLLDTERLLKPEIQKLQQKFEKIKTLEIGPGLHRFQVALKERRIVRPKDDLVVVDIIDEFLKAAPEGVHPEISIGDVPSKSIHFVFSFCVFQHLPADVIWRYSEELRRVMVSGGRAFIQVPNATCDYYQEKPTLHRFTPEEVRAFLGRGWRVKIEEGNLVRYFLIDESDWGKENRELFVIAERR